MSARAPLRMLVVDDEPAIRRFLRTSLTAQGHQVIEVEGLDLAALIGAAGKHDDGHRRALLAQPADDLEAIDARQAEIEDDHVGGTAAHGLQRGLAILDLDDLMALRREAGPEEAPDRGLVIDHQHAQRRAGGHHGAASAIGGPSRGTGNIKVKTAPGRSVRLPASICPPIASTKPRQMASPSPVPTRRRSAAWTR